MSTDPCTSWSDDALASADQIPRAHIDPIDREATALALLRAVVAHPSRHETIVVLLDGVRRGVSIVVVDGTIDPDDVVRSVEVVAEAVSMAVARHDTYPVHESAIGALVVASVRPDPIDHLDDLLDADRWLHLDEITERHGIELVEWFVLQGDGVDLISRPRELLDERPRWSPTRRHGGVRWA
ncbi:MAG: hypothetical protein ACO3D0_12020 [Ilumatobacteraceae bacterium]